MTPEQKSSFQENGFILLRKALGESEVNPLKAHVLSELNRLKIWSSGKVLSASIKSMPAFQQITKISSSIRLDNQHTKAINQKTLAAISALAETNLPPAQGQFLISLPAQGDWSLNGLNWHVDVSASAHACLPGVQAFILLDEVKPHGGGTLAIAGSHLLAGQEEGRKLREILRKEESPERELSSRNLSIVEMSGHAGDIYLMDMRVLHTPSINATRKVRMMATVRYLPIVHKKA